MYHNYLLDRTNEAFFCPMIFDSATEKHYKACEDKIWQYKDTQEQWNKVSFQELYGLWICKKINPSTLVRFYKKEATQGASSAAIQEEANEVYDFASIDDMTAYYSTCEGIAIENESFFQLKKALETPLNYIVPEITQHVTLSDQFFPLSRISGKPLIEAMWNFQFFSTYPELRNKILEKIDHQASFEKIFKLFIHQFLDVHANNVGIGPDSHRPDFFKMNSLLFQIDGIDPRELPLKDLMLLYLNNDINEYTTIKVYDPNAKRRRQILLKNYPELLRALNCPWNLYLFDCDRVMGESEKILTYSLNQGITGTSTMIPLQWHLLCSPQSMEKPLTKAT